METLIWVFYIGLLIFSLNGLVMIAMIKRIDKFEARAKLVESKLVQLKLRRRR